MYLFFKNRDPFKNTTTSFLKKKSFFNYRVNVHIANCGVIVKFFCWTSTQKRSTNCNWYMPLLFQWVSSPSTCVVLSSTYLKKLCCQFPTVYPGNCIPMVMSHIFLCPPYKLVVGSTALIGSNSPRWRCMLSEKICVCLCQAASGGIIRPRPLPVQFSTCHFFDYSRCYDCGLLFCEGQ